MVVVGKYSLDVVMISCTLIVYEGQYRDCYNALFSYLFSVNCKVRMLRMRLPHKVCDTVNIVIPVI